MLFVETFLGLQYKIYVWGWVSLKKSENRYQWTRGFLMWRGGNVSLRDTEKGFSALWVCNQPFLCCLFFFFSVSVFSFLLLPNSNGSPHLWPVMCWASGVRAGNKHIKSPPMLSLSNLASGRRVKVKWRRSLGRLERREGNGHNVSSHHMLGHLIYMLSPNTRESKSFRGR